MWKEIIICIIIVITIIMSNVITQRYTSQSIEKLSHGLGELKEYIVNLEEQENDEIKKQMEEKKEKVKEEWETRHDKLAYYIEHDELEKVETNLTSMNSFLETNEYAEAISELDKDIFILKHIKEKYEFNLENIF